MTIYRHTLPLGHNPPPITSSHTPAGIGGGMAYHTLSAASSTYYVQSQHNKSNSGWYRLEKRLPFRITWKFRVVTFLATGFILFFCLIFLVLHAATNESVAHQRALRNYASSIPLSIRRHRFEEVLASSLLRQPLVNHVVDELLLKVATLGEAVATRTEREISQSKQTATLDGMTRDEMLLFLFGTQDNHIGGSIGWEIEDIKFLIQNRLVELKQQQQSSTSTAATTDSAADTGGSDQQLHLHRPNLREKMTLLYIALMQPAGKTKERLLRGRDALTKEERRFYSIQEETNEDADSEEDTSTKHPTIFPLSLLLARESLKWSLDPAEHAKGFPGVDLQGEIVDFGKVRNKVDEERQNGDDQRTHWYHDASAANGVDTAGSLAWKRKCFLPLFVPLHGPVKSCRCVDTKDEDKLGCRQWRGLIEGRAPTTTDSASAAAAATPEEAKPWLGDRTAAQVQTPHLSRRELRFAFASLFEKDDVSDEEILNSKEYHSLSLPWISGSSLFLHPDASTNSALAMLSQVKHARFVSGPSSTTDAFLQLGEYMRLGVSPATTVAATGSTIPSSSSSAAAGLYLLRLSLIAYLVPAFDHSLMEVLVASSPFGLSPTVEELLQGRIEIGHSGLSTAEAFTHLIPSTLCLKGVRLESSSRGRTSARIHHTLDVQDCVSQKGTLLTRLELNDAISLALIQAFSPMYLHALHKERMGSLPDMDGVQRQTSILEKAETSSVPQHQQQFDTSHAGLCSDELAAYWTTLGLDNLHAQIERSGDPKTSRCDPTFFLRWLTRTIYQY